MFQIISEGNVVFTTEQDRVCGGPRIVLLPDGRVSIAGKWFFIDQPGESFWSDEAGGMQVDADGAIYNQRKTGTIGVWLSIAKPDATGFNIIANEPVWQAEIATRSNTSGDFSEWTDYSFGEPNVVVLPDGTFLLVLWYQQMGGSDIRYVHLKKEA